MRRPSATCWGRCCLSVLSGHKRYAHITGRRGDGVNPHLPGMKKVVSEDAVRRFLKKIEEGPGVDWPRRHLQYCTRPLPREPWIFVDTTIKPLCGKQEGTVVGYNPHKPGRPSHTYHTYMIANPRLILEVGVRAGNEQTSAYSAPGLWSFLGDLARDEWPSLLRGGRDWGTEANMSGPMPGTYSMK